MSRIDERSPNKVYVDVIDFVDDNGIHNPLFFRWIDGKRYEVDRVIKRDNECSLKAGGVGERYTVIIVDNGIERKRFMWLEDDRWFMERRT